MNDTVDAGAAADIRRVIERSRPRILAFLREFVACGSYCLNKAGVDRAAQLAAAEMPKSFAHEVFDGGTVGDHHLFSHERRGALPILMAGHLDTLCPPDASAGDMAERGDRLTGPGVNDMKGGDTVILWALKALEMCGRLDDLSVICLFNGDEELGSPNSNRLFRGMKGKVAAGLVFECGGPQGTVVTTRKGIQRYRLSITGRPCHFGNLKGAKVSAVEEMARKICAVEALNRPDGSIVANVGRAEGGLLANCVAGRADMDFEFRYWDPAMEDRVREEADALTRAAAVKGATLSLERLSARPPMQPGAGSRRLFDLTVQLGRTLGQPILEEKRGGVSDACWLSHAGIPTLDGLGPLGDDDHTPNEYIFAETLFQRIELAAHLLLALRREGALPSAPDTTNA